MMVRASVDRTIQDGHCRLLSCQDTRSTHGLDLLLSAAREETGLHNNRLLGQNSLAEDLVNTSSGAIDNWSLLGLGGVLSPGLLGDKRPQLVQVDAGLVEVGVVGVDVEVPHSNLAEVSGMVLVKVDPVVMLATSVSATSGVLPVLSDPTMTVGHVSSQLPGLLLGCGHSYFSCRSESSNIS